MKKYRPLNDEEISIYKNMLKPPKEEFPHYTRPVSNGIDIIGNLSIDPLKNEEFKDLDFIQNCKISNLGRVRFGDKILMPYIVGTFLHCTKVYIPKHGEFNIYRLVKETFDPIENMKKYQVHHLDNNALNNTPDNLIWVSIEDHRRIDCEFNQKLIKISRKIYEENKKSILELMNQNKERVFVGDELLKSYNNTYSEVIKNNVHDLVEKHFIREISEGRMQFRNRQFIYTDEHYNRAK